MCLLADVNPRLSWVHPYKGVQMPDQSRVVIPALGNAAQDFLKNACEFPVLPAMMGVLAVSHSYRIFCLLKFQSF